MASSGTWREQTSDAKRLADEHRAGREALFKVSAQPLLDERFVGLREKFKTIVSSNLRKMQGDEWGVAVTIQANDGKFYEVVDPFLGFPNDELIAQLMLLDPNS